MDIKDCVLLDSPQQAKKWLEPHHEANKTIGFVPTMGALHEGHLSLVRKATEQNEIVCVSIFVNPLQFNNPEDLEKYPRDINKDMGMLDEAGCTMVFTGTLESFFPQIEDHTQISLEEPGPFAQGLEGEFRPGHFAGVRTIVRRLFDTVGKCKAYFGAKDFQQTLVVKALAKEMKFPEIIVCPTQREKNGLAMSSRNQRLTPQQRQIAGKIFQALLKASNAWQNNQTNAENLEAIMLAELRHPEITVEYAQLRDPNNWSQDSLTGELSNPPQALIAVQVGDVRLIDNANLGNLLVIDSFNS